MNVSTHTPNPNVRQMLDRLRVRRDVRSDCTIVRSPGPNPEAAAELLALYRTTPFDANALVERVGALSAQGALSAWAQTEWLYKAAAHPEAQRLDEAERLLDQLENLANASDEERRPRALAVIERHRSWIAYQRRDNTGALEHSIRAYELEAWVADLHNVLCVLVRLGEDATARRLLADAERTLDPAELQQLHALGAADPDLSIFLS